MYTFIDEKIGFLNSNFNLKNTGSTLLFTQNDPRNKFFPRIVRIYIVNSSGLVTPPTLSVGKNASSYNNILPSTLTLSSATGEYRDYQLSGSTPLISYNDDVYVNITVGANATTYSGRIAVIGDSFSLT